LKHPTLRSLLAKMREGDENAFNMVYEQLAKPVYVIAYRITQSSEQAEDITQEVFLKLFITPPDETVKNPRAWIFRIVHNLSVDAVRKPVYDGLPEDLADTAETEKQILLQNAIDEAMNTLTCDERRVLTLHINAELTFHEIAGITNRSLAAVFRCYQRALKKLRIQLEEESS